MLCRSAVSFASCASLNTSIVYVVTFCWPRTELVSVVYRYLAHSSAKLPTLLNVPLGVTVVVVFVPFTDMPWKQLPVADMTWLERQVSNPVNVWLPSWLQPEAFIVWLVNGVSCATTVHFAKMVPPAQLAFWFWNCSLPPEPHDVPPEQTAPVRLEPAGIVMAFLHCVAFSQFAS